MAKTSTPTLIEYKLRIPESVSDVYAETAMKTGKSVEDVMTSRLHNARWWTGTQPIFINDDERQTLSRLAGKSMVSTSDIIAWATGLTQIEVSDVHVTLDEMLLKRLDSRASAMGQTIREYIHQSVIESLEREVGLR